jgi:hypothetical protein
MSCIVTYLTSPAGQANVGERMARGMVLMINMVEHGWHRSYGLDSRMQMDYALESPDIIPAGACEQEEVDVGTDEASGMPEYCISASQITIRREGVAP